MLKTTIKKLKPYNKYITGAILLVTLVLLFFIIKKNNRTKRIFNNIPMYCIFIPKRELYVKKMFDDLDLKVNFVKGVDKNKLNVEDLISQGKIKKWEQANPGRVACHFSHISVLEKFLKTNNERCIIFEDDITTTHTRDEIHNTMQNTLDNIPDDCDILFFGYCWDTCKKIKPVNEWINTAHYPRCRHAYSVNRHAAETIINKTLPMYNNGDEMMASLFVSNTLHTEEQELKAYLASNIVFEQNRGGESGFKSELGNNNKIKHCS
tara:strand:- start:10527 stop:11321 length:795 start_codon:yes stop_codon:yes gene_type:complete